MFTIHGSMTTRYPFIFIFDSEHDLEGDFDIEHPEEIVFDIEQNSFFKIFLNLNGITGNNDFAYRKLSIPSGKILIQAGWEFEHDEEVYYAQIPCPKIVEVEYLVEFEDDIFMIYINMDIDLQKELDV